MNFTKSNSCFHLSITSFSSIRYFLLPKVGREILSRTNMFVKHPPHSGACWCNGVSLRAFLLSNSFCPVVCQRFWRYFPSIRPRVRQPIAKHCPRYNRERCLNPPITDNMLVKPWLPDRRAGCLMQFIDSFCYGRFESGNKRT